MSDPGYPVDQLRAEVQEIAEVLQRQQPDQTIAELWEEALSLHRVRYQHKVLPPQRRRRTAHDRSWWRSGADREDLWSS